MDRTYRLSPAYGALAALAAVAVTTAVAQALREVVPAISLGVVYFLGVLAITSLWGLRLGIVTAVASALAFNVFHIPPTGELSIEASENLVALGLFLVVAIVSGTLAQLALARTRDAEEGRRSADLSAALARDLLAADDLDAALVPAGNRIADAFGLAHATLVRRDGPAELPAGSDVEALAIEDLGWLVVAADVAPRARRQLDDVILPALAALLRAAVAREQLLNEVVETRALRRSEELKTTLLRTVSHDLRTPLTAITASAEALASPGIPDDERHELALGAADRARDLSALIGDLLDLTRLEAGRAEPRRTWLALDEVLDAAAEGLARERVDLRLESELPLVHADATQLERAFHNLLDNAMRVSAGAPVTVRAKPVGDHLVIRVTDRGPGIPVEEHERIFEPFYRADSDRPRSAGSGLGLAIVRGFVEGNGGSVNVESYPGQGASFVVRLPLAEAAG